ncbi:diaminobutyrate acetyltransferase [Blastopirellula marina]|uniref:L-2,4-diaminobutyric acid acetyltransferase n=1 Tax=Blastopirellula marina DSM 3645 TaxID=314230 RepID=A3ZVE3_9BACT|nr:diaminobutyrate acetyltransferase [Blastopirellula marina]EAQ79289.1 Proteinase inhibitor I3, Kunitz legume [Blastopirellula marina DSM 3645]
MTETSPPAENDRESVRLRRPEKRDAQSLWRLVCADETLDTNSCYLYLLQATEFADSCVVAELNDEIVGFATGFRPPTRPQSLFVWQVLVAPSARGMGLAKQMLLYLVEQGEAVQFIEATITPSNAPSRGLFASLASRLGAAIEYSRCFEPADFGASDHEAEELVRVGPI